MLLQPQSKNKSAQIATGHLLLQLMDSHSFASHLSPPEPQRCQDCTESSHKHSEEKSSTAAPKTICADCGEVTSLLFWTGMHRRVRCASCFMQKFHQLPTH